MVKLVLILSTDYRAAGAVSLSKPHTSKKMLSDVPRSPHITAWLTIFVFLTQTERRAKETHVPA